MLKNRILFLAVLLTAFVTKLSAQGYPKPLFSGDDVVQCSLMAHFDSLQDDDCKNPKRFEAIFMYNYNGIADSYQIGVKKRGKFRCESSSCVFPPLMLNFPKKEVKTGLFKDQDKLKLVNSCRLKSENYQNLIFKEYLSYRILNLLTEYSLRVRLLKIKYINTAKDNDTLSRYGFVIEQPEDMAVRTKANLLKATNVHPNDFNRRHMTVIDLFEFMIGNTDWSTTEPHNIIIVSTNPFEKPLPVPYDFDWSGLVNAPYAVPMESLGLSSVSERLYMGFCRTPEEYQQAFDLLNQKKESIYKLIQQFDFMPLKERNSMIKYLDGFYQIINSRNAAEKVFQNWCK
jgi:hypothetical protein